MAWFFLKGYQKERILAFLDPQGDPLGAGYHIIQSKIAVGSGLFFGKGFLKGTQNALSFIPEQHTDFIFSVLAEEWGFLGSVTIIILYLLLIIWGLSVAVRSKDPFGTVLAVGLTSMIFWQTFINVAMVLALLPVVGVPLPLISYGGSSMLANMVAITSVCVGSCSKIDGCAKSPSAVLCVIFRRCDVPYVRLTPQDLLALHLELFFLPSSW
jgi:rod shape determining protein RodA